MVKYRTEKPKKKPKKVKTKYPLQPIAAMDKHGFASELGECRRILAEQKDLDERHTYTLKNLHRYNYEPEQIEQIRADAIYIKEQIKELEELIKKHEGWIEFLMSWEEALDCLKKAVEDKKAYWFEDSIWFIAEGVFERDRFKRAIVSVFVDEHYAPVESTIEKGTWLIQCKLKALIYEWLKIPESDDEVLDHLWE